jgi:radical SAM protein with 4Fe4S-binding SPASM domain
MRIEYFIFVSNNCNLGCSYCSVLSNFSLQKFPKEPNYKIDELLSFISNQQNLNNSKNFDIYFFGGEPTLNIRYMIEVINTIEERFIGYTIRFILHTNGLRLMKLPSEIFSKLFLIIISINYEKIPRFNLVDGYFGTIVNNIANIKSKTNIPKFLARLTITENVSLYNNVIQISNFFDYIYWQIQNCQHFIDFECFKRSYEFELNLLWDYWLKFIKQNVKLHFLPFLGCLHLFQNKPINSDGYLCGFNKFMIYIQTDGSCYSCAEEILENEYFKIGDINNGISFKNQKNPFDICETCEYKIVCRGRCGRMQERFLKEHINEYCILNKLLFKLVKDHLESTPEISIIQLNTELDDYILGLSEYVP